MFHRVWACVNCIITFVSSVLQGFLMIVRARARDCEKVLQNAVP